LGIKKFDPERGSRIEELMEETGFSDSHLASVLGLKDGGNVGRWRKGKAIHSPNVGPLAQLLGTNRRYLVTGKGEKGPPPEEAALLREDLSKLQSSLLDGLSRLSQEAERQRRSLEDLLQRVERLERD
jgi:transcriptional regulator with XRE-family HTH domain